MLLAKKIAIFGNNNCNSNAAKLADKVLPATVYSATGFYFVKFYLWASIPPTFSLFYDAHQDSRQPHSAGLFPHCSTVCEKLVGLLLTVLDEATGGWGVVTLTDSDGVEI